MIPTNLASARLYGFIDTAYLAGRDPAELTEQLIQGGVNILQVRAKGWTHPQRVDLALRVRSVAVEHNVPVIVNDDVDAAFEADADGVHLGQEDWVAIPRDQRMERLAHMRIVGLSTHSLEQALAAERHGASYIGVGPVFPTGTKPGVPAVGLDLVRQAAERIRVPFFAIGGINLANLCEVLKAGASRVAVVSAILQAPDVAAAAAAFKQMIVGDQRPSSPKP